MTEEQKKWISDMVKEFEKDKYAKKYRTDSGSILIFDENAYRIGLPKEHESESETNQIAFAYANLRDIEFPSNEPEPVFKRAEKGHSYYSIWTNCKELAVTYGIECNLESNDESYDCGNYFLSEEKAQRVADKMNFLLKLEKLRETYCPDFFPDWENDEGNRCRIFFNHSIDMFDYTFEVRYEDLTDVYFPSDNIAEKVCDILNEEYGFKKHI